MEDCAICCEPFNKQTRKVVTCPSCSGVACMNCTKTYLGTMLNPACMHCKAAWNSEFLRSTFPLTWLQKEYRALREQVLFDLEIAKLPDTQRFADAWIEREGLRQEQKDIKTKTSELKETIQQLHDEYLKSSQRLYALTQSHGKEKDDVSRQTVSLFKRKQKFENELKSLTEKSQKTAIRIAQLTRTIEDDEEPIDIPEVSKEKPFIMACPAIDCRGFLETNWKCGLCKAQVCKKCHQIQTENAKHTCKDEDVASVKMLADDSKPCPKCGSLIYKISGCNQMWCTACRTAFDWLTGDIQQGGIIHNPHYFQYMRDRGQDIQHGIGPQHRQRQCGDLFVSTGTYGIMTRLRNHFASNEERRDSICSLVRLLLHIHEVEIPNGVLPADRRIPRDPNRELRIDYLINRLTRDEFCRKLYAVDRERNKRRETCLILTMFMQVADDLLERFLEDNLTEPQFINQLDQLLKYTNGALEIASAQFGLPTYIQIPEGFDELKTVKRKRTSKETS